jgi:succinate dehydrogenase / fumarate reductase membrane anchor subunit
VVALNISETSESSVKGSRHWWLQRVSAVALVPLTLWFLFSIVHHVGSTQEEVLRWIAQPYVSFLLVIYLGFMFFHGQLGMQEIIEDYVHSQKLKTCFGVTIKFVLIVSALAAIYSVLRIAL